MSDLTTPVTDDELQALRDLIINRCEHVPHWHKKGAQALWIVNRLAAQVETLTKEARDAA